jgi:hypothetical protein
MPSPIQTQIRDAMHTRLLTIDGTGGYYNNIASYVTLDREDGRQIDDGWNVNLRILSDEKQGEDTCKEQRTLTVRIEITRRASAPVEDDLITAAADVRRSLKDHRQLGGLCTDIGYARWEKPMSEIRQIIAGELWIEFAITYQSTSFED